MCRTVEKQSRDRYLENDCLYKCVFKWDLKQAPVFDIKASVTSGGRRQISWAVQLKARLANAVRTPWGTERRWRADDRRTRLGSCHCTSDARYSDWPVCSALHVSRVILYVVFDWIGSQYILFSTGVVLSNLRVRVKTRLIEFCRRCGFTMFVFDVPKSNELQ